MPYQPDPNNPNVQAASRMISELVWQYVTTHTAEECEALKRRIEERRQIRERLFGTPIPVNITADKSA